MRKGDYLTESSAIAKALMCKVILKTQPFLTSDKASQDAEGGTWS